MRAIQKPRDTRHLDVRQSSFHRAPVWKVSKLRIVDSPVGHGACGRLCRVADRVLQVLVALGAAAVSVKNLTVRRGVFYEMRNENKETHRRKRLHAAPHGMVSSRFASFAVLVSSEWA